jgi:hypothetical protein
LRAKGIPAVIARLHEDTPMRLLIFVSLAAARRIMVRVDLDKIVPLPDAEGSQARSAETLD